eukprot:CAMPEP_0116023886 /NCGR_PEP_ID=MMETSP0321-20121206/11927_1 /TAXON_ID=163516 /ORGANISM="Leptocylindrus danicus var. danicus, Strain B650" /LENGTH=138 /DNA_ID=CAMNT_0003495389 /DNA_START=237 /DNA_END=653 /DNA_ORIENTATION=-
MTDLDPASSMAFRMAALSLLCPCSFLSVPPAASNRGMKPRMTFSFFDLFSLMRLLGKEAIVPEMEPSTDADSGELATVVLLVEVAAVQVERDTTSGALFSILLLVLLIKAETEAGKGDDKLMVDMLLLILDGWMDDGV